MPRSAPVHVLVMATLAVAFAACAPAAPAVPTSSPSATAPAAPSPSAPASASQTSSTAAATPSIGATATPKATGTAQVDLTFTGALAFTAKGTAGQCLLGTPVGGGLPTFAFNASEADYPRLGQSFSLLQFAGTNPYVDLKWVIDDNNAYGQSGPVYTGTNTITLSADHRAVTLDAQLSGLAPQGKPVPGPEHVTGTITCP